MLSINGFTCGLVYSNDTTKEIPFYFPMVCDSEQWKMASCWVSAEILSNHYQGGHPMSIYRIDCKRENHVYGERDQGWVVWIYSNGSLISSPQFDTPVLQHHLKDQCGVIRSSGRPGTPGYLSTGPGMITHSANRSPASVAKRAYTYFSQGTVIDVTEVQDLQRGREIQSYATQKHAGHPSNRPKIPAVIIEVIVMPPGRYPIPLLSRQQHGNSGHLAYFRFASGPQMALEFFGVKSHQNWLDIPIASPKPVYHSTVWNAAQVIENMMNEIDEEMKRFKANTTTQGHLLSANNQRRY